jgi:hypothetical protein
MIRRPSPRAGQRAASPAGGLTPKRTLTATQRAAVDGLAERLGL